MRWTGGYCDMNVRDFLPVNVLFAMESFPLEIVWQVLFTLEIWCGGDYEVTVCD